MTAPPLRLTLTAPDSVRAGEAVPLAIRVTNTGDRPVEAYFVGRDIAFDFVVRDSGGAVVWQRLADRAVQSILQVRTLKAGETVELRDVWRQRDDGGKAVAPGTYAVQGVVPGQEQEPLKTETKTLRITRN